MSRYIDKDKLLDKLPKIDANDRQQISKVGALRDFIFMIEDVPEADAVGVNDILIVSIYDGAYNCSVFAKGELLYDPHDFDDEKWEVCCAFCCPIDECKALQIMNKYNVSRAILCEDGCIEIFEKRGNELCRTL